MDKNKLLDEKNLASESRRLLDDKTLNGAFETVEENYLNALLQTNLKDDTARFRYAEAINVLRLVRLQLQSAANNGKLAEHELKQLAGKKPKRFGIV